MNAQNTYYPNDKGGKRAFIGDILVLDLADEQGGFCSKLLADLGARVIKVEKPEGDSSRRVGPFYDVKTDGGRSSLFFSYHNTNKLGLTLDLDKKAGRRIFHKLVKKADVLIETFPPGHLRALRLSFGLLRHINPSLIHVSITGFGQKGPKRHYRSCDSIASASGGQMYVSGIPSGPPVKPPGQQSYYAASLFGAVAVLLALRKRKLTGKGCSIDLSTQEAVASTLDHIMVDYFDDKTIARRQGNVYGNSLFCILPCKDGHIQITILQNWETLLELMSSEGKADNLFQEDWQQQIYREEHFDHIMEVVGRWTRNHTKVELFELGQAMRLPWAPVDSPEEVLKSPQLAARRFFVETELPGAGLAISLPGPPYKFSSFSPPSSKAAPLLGEHTKQILEELGVSGRRMEELARMKVI
jgi:crotonobetainyl-CoA:carnitine CoA-transferase CaiB-like acyl-CoA transferase